MKTLAEAPPVVQADRDLLEVMYGELVQVHLLVAQLTAVLTGEAVRVPLPLHL